MADDLERHAVLQSDARRPTAIASGLSIWVLLSHRLIPSPRSALDRDQRLDQVRRRDFHAAFLGERVTDVAEQQFKPRDIVNVHRLASSSWSRSSTAPSGPQAEPSRLRISAWRMTSSGTRYCRAMLATTAESRAAVSLSTW